jgi:hypothetical protein
MSITPTSSESDAAAVAEGVSSRGTARIAAVEKAKDETSNLEVDEEITSVKKRSILLPFPPCA